MHGTEESLEQKSFAQLRPLVVSSEILAVAVCLIVLIVADASQGISPLLYGFSLLSAGICLLTWRARTTQHLWLSGLLLVCACTACLGALANAIGNPGIWFLPIGLVFSLPVSAMHAHPGHALSTGIAVWATLFAVVQPGFDRQLDLTLTLMLIAASLMIASMVCTTLCRTRKDVFDLQRQLHDMAYRDTLTGLPNRRAFIQRLTATVSAGGARVPLFFLMLDIDDFKKINDGHGHDVGDKVLVEVARVLSDQTAGHNVARLGGEEFAVAAQLAGVDAARALAQQIVDAVNAQPVIGVTLSISIGVAEHLPDETLFSLMRRADRALYEAKHHGKNRFAMAASTMATA